MTGSRIVQAEEQLMLRSRLAEGALITAWIERLASQHGISDEVKFAMDLCLEEVFSNIVRHGYAGRADGRVSVRFAMPQENEISLAVEDEAPHYNPLDAPQLPALNPQDEIRVGGQGVRLLRQFANTLQYEATPNGNRLKLGFSRAGTA